MSVPFRIRRAEWIAGAFLVLVGTLIIAALLVVSRGQGTFDVPVHYQVMLADGHGVAEGSRVQMLGIDVGRVDTVTLTEDNRIRVGLEIRSSFAHKVRADSEATLQASFGLQGVLAGVGIAVSPGTEGAPALREGEEIPAVEPEHIADLLPGVGADPLVEDLEVLVRNLRLLTEDATDPEGDVRRVVASLAVVAGRIEAGEGTAGAMLSDDAKLYGKLIDTLGEVETTLARIDGVVGRSDRLVKKTSTVVASADAVMGSADAMFGEASTMVEGADGVVASVDGLVTKTEPVIEHSDAAIAKLGKAIDAFGGTTEELTAVTKRLDTLIAEMLVVTEAAGRVYPIRRHVRKIRREKRR